MSPPTALFAFRGSHSGWLFKEKGDSALAKWFNPVGKRYFTIDFDGQVVTYSHSDSGKQAGQIAFRDIFGATASFEECASRDGNRAPSTVIKRASMAPPGTWPFELITTSRRIRLAAELEKDALRWISMLNSAHVQGRAPVAKPLPIRGGDDSGGEGKAPSVRSDKASQQSTTPGASTPNTTGSRASTPKSEWRAENPDANAWNDVVLKMEELERTAASSYRKLRESQEPPSKLTSVSQLAVEPENVAVEETPSPPSPPSTATCSPTRRLQASDFGFEEDEGESPTDAEEDQSPAATPRAPVTSSFLAEAAEHESSDEENTGKAEASRVVADLLLLQTKGAQKGAQINSAEAARIAADLALLEKMRRATVRSSKRSVTKGKESRSLELDLQA